MLFDFTYTVYSLVMPFLLVLSFFLPKTWKETNRKTIAVFNVLLVVFCIIYLYRLYQLSQTFKDFKGNYPWFDKQKFFVMYGHIFLAMFLSATIPFLFIIKKLRASLWLVAIELLLIWWGDIWVLLNKIFSDGKGVKWTMLYTEYDLYLKIPFFISLFVGTYALLWLLKQFPSKHKL